MAFLRARGKAHCERPLFAGIFVSNLFAVRGEPYSSDPRLLFSWSKLVAVCGLGVGCSADNGRLAEAPIHAVSDSVCGTKRAVSRCPDRPRKDLLKRKDRQLRCHIKNGSPKICTDGSMSTFKRLVVGKSEARFIYQSPYLRPQMPSQNVP